MLFLHWLDVRWQWTWGSGNRCEFAGVVLVLLQRRGWWPSVSADGDGGLKVRSRLALIASCKQMVPVVPRDNYDSCGWCCQARHEDNGTANECFKQCCLCCCAVWVHFCAPRANQQIASVAWVQLIWIWNSANFGQLIFLFIGSQYEKQMLM